MIIVRDRDRYRRLVVEVILPDGQSLNHEIVRSGSAWWYRRYAPADKTLERLENEARRARRGLWSDRSPVAPWDRRAGAKLAPALSGYFMSDSVVAQLPLPPIPGLGAFTIAGAAFSTILLARRGGFASKRRPAELLNEAVRGRGTPMETERRRTCRRAAWIWKIAHELFPRAIEIVDKFHAKEHLSQLAGGAVRTRTNVGEAVV